MLGCFWDGNMCGAAKWVIVSKIMCPKMTTNSFFRQLALVYMIAPVLPPFLIVQNIFCLDKAEEESTCVAKLGVVIVCAFFLSAPLGKC